MTLDEIYERIPKIACQGKCFQYCGPIAMGQMEADRMEAATGERPRFKVYDGTCGYLRAQRCSAYEHRPLICRLWGVVEDLRCPFGCSADRILSKEEASGLMRAMLALSEHKIFIMDVK